MVQLTLFSTAVVLGIWSFLLLESDIKLLLILPVIISLVYVIPTFKSQRARDIPYLKIFLISITWAMFYIIPSQSLLSSDVLAIFLEKFLFIFAITIPFDLRDLEIDSTTGLKTLVHLLHPEKALKLSASLIGMSLLVSIYLCKIEVYSMTHLIALAISYLTAILLIMKSSKRSEFYYLAYLDGTILLQGFLIVLCYII